MENPFIEAFNGRLRDECLNVDLFFSLNDARRKLECWRQDYNHFRSHSALADRTPAQVAAAWTPGALGPPETSPPDRSHGCA
jgi:putative transposase